ncbi:helix-turn-helix domain-containing protein [Mangrovimonas sp. CR14]|uniref:helix-turn-helix domain-containing protein n=1 Tax=Mangrovimonas sp. CR14 TaxID=2706120 RepID=UPI00142011F5|nr:helix-turn-helix domain-containing protein [Mangrovimonas sp. CR14]NIK91599.1 helix-turn-helix domain-containing protein [Mangrovimonas sp. CR14]
MESLLSKDQSFISKLNEILEKHYQNENFGVNKLALTIGISRSQLHRKLHDIKGVTTSKYIRLFRLQKAFILLKNDVSTVSEIAYDVGFSNVSYFIKCFRKTYHCSPGELKAKIEQGTLVGEEEEPQPISFTSSTSKNPLFDRLFKYSFGLGGFRINAFKIAVSFLMLFTVSMFYHSLKMPSKQMSKSLAIMPFEVKSTAIEKDILSEGVQKGLTSSLGKIKKFNVLSSATTAKYKDSKLSMEEIIKELNVDFLVSGKVDYLQDDRLVLNVTVYKLGAPKAGLQTFDFNTSIENIITVQNEVSKRIALYIGVLDDNHSEIGYYNRKINKNAYKNYIKGMYYLHKSSQEYFDKGIRFLYKSLDDDPSEPLAYAGLAYGHVILGHSSAQNKNVFGTAKIAARQAIELDSTLLEAYASMASIAIYHDRSWKEAEDLFRYILSRNSSMANVHYDYAWYCLLIGKEQKAIYHHEMAEKLDPFNVKYMAWGAWLLAYYGHYKEAAEKVEEALNVAPDNAIAYLAKGFIYRKKGKMDKAIQTFERLHDLTPGYAGMLGNIYALNDDLDKTHELLKEVENWPKSAWRNFNLAMLYAGLNDAQMAVKMLETEPKHAFVAWAMVVPEFEGIKNDPRFEAFVSSLNLPKEEETFQAYADTQYQ